MMRKIAVAVIAAALTLAVAPAGVWAVGSYNWDPSVPNHNPSATVQNGTIDTTTLVVGDFLGFLP